MDEVNRQVGEKKWREDLAEDYLFRVAWNAVRSAFRDILKDAELKVLLEPIRVHYRNRRDGTGTELRDVNLDGITERVESAHKTKLKEICFS